MIIEITGRHVQVTQATQDYARAKAEKVAKFLKGEVRVEVILDHERERFQVETIVTGNRGPVIVAHVQHEDARAAVDLVMDKVQEQLRRTAERRKDHRGESMAGEDSLPAGDAGQPEVTYDDIIDEELNQ